MRKYDIVVVGGGASGLLAAGKAAKDGSKVLLIEKMNRLGRKLLITGKGRCNITNNSPRSEHFKHIFPTPSFLKHSYGVFFNNDIVNLLSDLGVDTVVERGERVFPSSEKSADVVNALIAWCKNAGVEIKTETSVLNIDCEDSKVKSVEIESKSKTETILCKAVILCTGGCSYPATGSTGDGFDFAAKTGHKVIKPLPALVPIETYGNRAIELQGLSLKNVRVSMWVNSKKHSSEFGEMLFTHFGLSGPIILTMSRNIVVELENLNKVELVIDLKPALDDLQLDRRLLRDIEENPKKQIKQILRQWMPASMIPVFIEEIGLDAYKVANSISSEQRKKIRLLMKNMRFEVKGYRPFEEAIITSGGVSTADISSKTMQSKIIEGLYFAGEILDLDADTGGYNLQIAWSTAWLAAQSATKAININKED